MFLQQATAQNLYLTLDDAAKAAMEIEICQQQMTSVSKYFESRDPVSKNCYALQSDNKNNFPRNANNNNNHNNQFKKPSQNMNMWTNSNNNNSPQGISCVYCKRTNHTVNDCRVLEYHKNNNNKSNSENTIPECSYCKKKYHIIDVCRKRVFNEDKRKNQPCNFENAGNEQTFPRSGAPTGNVLFHRQIINQAQ